jgi:acyl-[acyl-carrier-protein]-phospholipid O-acyltransferase/long-chain-fatty-acid--[acyl-carrier-protein] ligase
MWKIKGTIRYFFAMWMVTFVQMGVFIYIQQMIAGSNRGEIQDFRWESLLLQVFVLTPYVVFAPLASFLSNRFPKQKVLAWTSVIMTAFLIAMAVCATVGVERVAYWLFLGLATGFALHSPAKYGILKEMCTNRYLGYANAFLQIVFLLALVAASGLCLGGVELIRSGFENVPNVNEFLSSSIALPWILTGFSVFGTILSFFIPKVGTESQFTKIRSVKREFQSTLSNPVIRATILGISMFWGMAQIFVLIFQDTNGQGISFLKYSILFAFLGLAIGSIWAAKSSKNFIETGHIPLGMLLVLISTFLIPFMPSSNLVLLAILFSLAGLGGGMFLVPLNSLLLYHTRPRRAGRILAIGNLVQALILAGFLGIYTLLLYYFKIEPQYFLIGLGLVAAVCFTWSIFNMPQAMLRSLLKVVFGRYKLRVLGVQNIPDNGPVLLIGSHHSFIDWAVLQMASPRPLCIASNKDHFDRWYLRAVLKRLGMIRIDRRDPSKALKRVREELLNGKAVVLFPTGEVSKVPHIVPFLMDYSEAVRDTGAPVVPFYIQGLWGSRYSYSNSDMYGASASRSVTVAFGEPVANDTPESEIRTIIRHISLDAWNHTVSKCNSLAISWLRTCKKIVRSGPVIYNPDGSHFSGYKLLCAVLAFGGKLKAITQNEKNVGIMLPPTPAGIIVNLGLWMLGKTTVNLNYTSSPSNVSFCIEQADVKTVITSRTFLEKLRNRGNDYSKIGDGKCELIFAEDVMKSIPKIKMLFCLLQAVLIPARILQFLYFKRVKLSDTATILFSSGSEGRPKGVVLSHRNMIGNIQQLACIMNVCTDDVMLCELPLFHSFGLTVTTALPLVEGCPVVTIADPTDIKTMARACAEFKVTLFVGTPTFLRAFAVNRWVHPMVFKYLRLIIAGAERLRPELQQAFRVKFGKEIFEGYGCTETAPVASVNTENVLLSDFLTMQVNTKSGTVGMALPGTQFLIVDPETNEELPVGEAGMILIGGCQVMEGYLKDPERTKNAFVMIDGNKFYRTGDKGYIDSDGFLTIVDRYSRFAKLGGEMVSLGAVEKFIQDLEILDGFDYSVTTVADEAKGERIVLLYQNMDKTPADLLSELRASGMPPLMIPSFAFQVENMPKLGTGKTDYMAAKKMAAELVATR